MPQSGARSVNSGFPAGKVGRFQTSSLTLFIDRFMTRFIKVGGIGVIAAVCAIFVFIFIQVAPLFESAKVKELAVVDFPPQKYVLIGANETAEYLFAVDASGRILLSDLSGKKPLEYQSPLITKSKIITAIEYVPQAQTIYYGTSDGYYSSVKLDFIQQYGEQTRTIEPRVVEEAPRLIGREGYPVLYISAMPARAGQTIGVIQQIDGRPEVHAIRFVRSAGLFADGELTLDADYDLTPQVSGVPDRILIGSQGRSIIVTNTSGQVFYFRDEMDGFERVQIFTPFQDTGDPSIASIDFLLGGNSLVMTNASGLNVIFSAHIPPGASGRLYGQTKKFEPLPSGAAFFDASLRNKAFLTGSGRLASIRYGTTEAVRWQKKLPFEIQTGRLGQKYDRIFCSTTRIGRIFMAFGILIRKPDSRRFSGLFGMRDIRNPDMNGSRAVLPTNSSRSYR